MTKKVNYQSKCHQEYQKDHKNPPRLWLLFQQFIKSKLEKFCEFLNLVQWSNVPAIYERSYELLCEFLILVQWSKVSDLYDMCNL